LECPAEPCGAGEGGEAASAGGAQKDGIGWMIGPLMGGFIID